MASEGTPEQEQALEGRNLQPIVSKLLVLHSDIDGVVVTGKSITSYFESRSVTVVNVSHPTEEKYIVSVTAKPKDIKEFCAKNHEIKKHPIKIEPYSDEMANFDTIEVLYPPEILNEDDLENYFTGPVSGKTDKGEDKVIEWVKIVEPGKSYIKFESHKDAAYVLAKQNHKFMTKALTVSAVQSLSRLTTPPTEHNKLSTDTKCSPISPHTTLLTPPTFSLPSNDKSIEVTLSTKQTPPHIKPFPATPTDMPLLFNGSDTTIPPVNDGSGQPTTHTDDLTSANPDVVPTLNECSTDSQFKYEKDKLIIRNIPDNITKEFVKYHLENTLEMDCEGNYSFELQDNYALLTFTNQYTVEELKSFCENITSQKMKGQFPLAELQRITVADGIEEGDGSMQGHDKKYERNKLIIKNIPEGVDDDESFGVIIGGMLELDEDDSSFSIELKKASALLTFDKEYSIEELKGFCKKIASEKLKGQVLVAELCKTNCTVLITEIAKKLFASQDELKKYFKNKRTGGGRDVVEDIVMLDKKKAKVTFKTSQTVASVLSKDHSVLGPNVKIIACSPLIDIEEDKSSEELCDDTPSSLLTEKRKKSSLSSADEIVIESKKMRRDCPSKRINLDLLVAKYLSNNSKLLDDIGREVSVTATVVDRDNGVIEVLMNDIDASPDDLGSAVTQFQSLVSSQVHRTDIHFPPEANAEASKLIVQFSATNNFPVDLTLGTMIGNCIGIAGLVHHINDLEKMVHDLCDRIVPTSEQIPLSSEDYNFFSEYAMKEATKVHSTVKIDKAKNVISVSGSKRDVAYFKQSLDSLIQHATVPVQVSKLGMEFLKDGKGTGILQTLINHDKIIPFFSEDSSGIISLSLLCPHNAAQYAENVSTKISITILEKELHFPQYFYTNVVDSPQFNNFIQKISARYAFLCRVEKNVVFKLVCRDEIQNKLSDLFQKFVSEECSITESIQMKRGVWRLFNSTMEKNWSKLEAEMVKNGLQVLSKSKPTSSKPFLKIKGERNMIAQMKKKFIELQKSVHELEFTVARPGLVQHFYNDPHGKVSLTGIESAARVCIELEVKKDENESDPPTPTDIGTNSFKKVCTANTRGVTVNLYTGDITQFNRAEVIVNAANEDLIHGSGVAGAIVDRGGSIISKDSQDYVSKKGRVPTGSAVLFRRVGNLPPPYQAIVHAVGPRWSSQSGSDKADKDTALLRKTVKNTLKQAKNFNSIAIPAISSGIFGFPVDVAANSLVQGVIDFIENVDGTNSGYNLNEINFVLIDDKVSAFKQAIKKHLHNAHMFNETSQPSVTAATTTTPTTNRVSPQISLRTRSRSRKTGANKTSLLMNHIKITKDSILNHQCEVLVNTTDQKLNFAGQVGQVLIKAAGSGLQHECQAIPKPIQYGDIVTTKAHQLHSKHIVHVVLPNYGGFKSEKVLKGVVSKCLQESTHLNAKSISIPSIGAGNLRYPSDVVAKCLLEEAFQYLSNNEGQTSLQLVHFVIYDDAVYQAFQQHYSQMLTSVSADCVDPDYPVSSDTKLKTTLISSTPRKKRSSKQPSPSASSVSNSLPRLTPDVDGCKFVLPNGIQLCVIEGDITNERTDVIVNTTNPDLLLASGGVSNALLKKGGQALQDACDQTIASNMKAAEGKVVETRCEGIGQLCCKSIFHIVFEGKEQKKLVKTILACLERAEKMQYTSIAIPAIGTGNINYPSAKAAEGIVTALKQFTHKKTHHVQEIRMVIFQPSMFKEFTDAFRKIKESSGEGILNYIYGKSSQYIADKRSQLMDTFSSILIPHDGDQSEYVTVATTEDDTDISCDDHDEKETEEFFDCIATPLDKDVLSNISFDTEVTMCIYGENELAVKRAEKNLRSILDNLIITEEVDDVNIMELSGVILSDLKSLAHKHNVDIEIDKEPHLHTIKLHGCQNDVLKVKDKVRDALSHFHQLKTKKEVAVTISKHVKWVRQLSADRVEDYDELYSYEIEQAYQKKKSSYHHDETENGDRFIIDFSTMEETDLDNQEKVKVVRVDFAEAYEKPSNWVPMPKDSNKIEATVHLVALKLNDPEYKNALSKFDDTMQLNYSQIVSIQRIQNPVLHGQYLARKKEMEKRNPSGCQNEKWLFHGTKPANIDAINTQGLNRSFKNVTAYGQGVYFARDASYSHRYTQPDHNSHHHMYLARVLTGEYTVGNSKMIIPPPKNHQQNQHIVFDSTVDNIVDPSIFVVYTDSQVYTAYLIIYQ